MECFKTVDSWLHSGNRNLCYLAKNQETLHNSSVNAGRFHAVLCLCLEDGFVHSAVANRGLAAGSVFTHGHMGVCSESSHPFTGGLGRAVRSNSCTDLRGDHQC